MLSAVFSEVFRDSNCLHVHQIDLSNFPLTLFKFMNFERRRQVSSEVLGCNIFSRLMLFYLHVNFMFCYLGYQCVISSSFLLNVVVF